MSDVSKWWNCLCCLLASSCSKHQRELATSDFAFLDDTQAKPRVIRHVCQIQTMSLITHWLEPIVLSNWSRWNFVVANMFFIKVVASHTLINCDKSAVFAFHPRLGKILCERNCCLLLMLSRLFFHLSKTGWDTRLMWFPQTLLIHFYTSPLVFKYLDLKERTQKVYRIIKQIIWLVQSNYHLHGYIIMS